MTSGVTVCWDAKGQALGMGVTTGKSGSGLGLFHVRQVVGTMGGTIEAMPEPFDDDHQGAHIRIKLPA